MPDRQDSEKKIFSYDDALRLLPEVRRITEEAYRRVEALGTSTSTDAGTVQTAQTKLDAIVTTWARSLIEKGLEVKGLWLVDFDNGSGYYCWRYPEEALQYYHSYEEGFSGRMRIQ